jgi:hypothetical protein
MIEGSESGSIPLTSGSGSWRPKNTWIRLIRIRIRNTGYSDIYNITCPSGCKERKNYPIRESGVDMIIDQVCYYFSGGSSTLSSRLEMAYVYQVLRLILQYLAVSFVFLIILSVVRKKSKFLHLWFLPFRLCIANY